MTEPQAVEAIYQYWLANWTGSKTFFEGEVASSIICGWNRVSVTNVLSIQDALGPDGKRRFLNKLAVQIQVFEPIGGVEQVLTAANNAKNVFEGKTITVDGITDYPSIDFYQVNVRKERIDGPWLSRTVEALCNTYETK